MAAAAVLRPATSQVEFTARPALRPSKNPAAGDGRSPPDSGKHVSGPSSASTMVANPKLSVIEIEALLREKVRAKHNDLHKAFVTYDRDNTSSVTRGEFRRVLESFCMVFSTEQFENIMNKVDTNPNGTVRYNEFLDKFYGKGRPKPSKSADRWVNKNFNNPVGQPRPVSPHEMNTDMTEKMIRDKITGNLKSVVKALRLYDYNRDGYIQRHELRKVLENFCFKMTDNQYDKLYQRYDFHHRGVISYKEFLQKLGVNVDKMGKPMENGALNWSQQPQKVLPPNKMGLKKADDSPIKGMSIEEIEVEFRHRMIVNYGNLKRMFLCVDKNLDGMVSLEDLRSVLNHFTFAMSDQLFQQLMARFSFKASGKISWEAFLEKFQDPQAHGNGQTVTIKPGHKFFPIRGAEETMDLPQIIRLLDNHVKNAYSSFKNAFLQIDKNRDGRITRKELKNIIEGFKFRLTDGQFTELFSVLDPQHTNAISYHAFLELFEPKESIMGHKWLNSCHRYNDKQKPTILAWKTVEEILKDRIEDNWKDCAKAIMACDEKGSGMIFMSELRRILEKFCLPVSDNHFENMMSRLSSRDAEGRVSYMEFLGHLNVTVSPGDLKGLSTQIQQAHDQAMAQHGDDQMLMQEQIEERMLGRTAGMTVDELLIRIKDRIMLHNRDMPSAFRVFDRTNKGKISKRDFREVCESHGIYMPDTQFKELCKRLQFVGGHMKYLDFVANFEDLREGGDVELIRVNNHHVNHIRGDEYGLSALEAESKLRNKLRENFEGLRGAFYKFDDTHKGHLTKAAFRRMLDAFMMRMSGEEFDKLCARLGVDKNTKISYNDFLAKFETKEPIEGHKWLISNHKYNEVQPMGLMRAEDVHEVLVQKAHRHYTDLAKAFRTMDSTKKGVISKKDLRSVLYKFMLPISKPEFNRLWEWYDRGGKGFLTHQDFLKRVEAADQFSSGDQAGASADIIKASQARLQEQHQEQLEKQEEITLNQAFTTTTMSVDTILQGLKDKIRDNYSEFRDAFKLYDKKNKGYLSVADMQKVLVDFHYILDDDQLFDLFDRLGISTKKSKLSYEEFLGAFEEGRKDGYEGAPEQVGLARVLHEHLSPEQAEEKMRKRILAQLPVIQMALAALDRGSTGFIDVRDFRRVLDNFCFKMSNKQFKHFRSKLGVNKDNSMDYTFFLESFQEVDPDSNPQKWVSAMEQRLEEAGPREMSMEAVHGALRELVTARLYSITRALAETDYAQIGVVSKADFRDVLNKTVMRLSDDQFDRLWSTLRVNEFGNLEYNDFINHYTSADPRSQRPPSTASSMRPGTMEGGRRLHTSSGRPITPLVNAAGTEERVREKIQRHWQDIQKQCRAVDPSNAGHISQEDIKAILDKYKLGLSYDDQFKLILKYDLHNNSRFCYREFIKNFVLNMSGTGGGGEARPASAGGRLSRLMEGRASRMDSGGPLSRQKMAPSRLSPMSSPGPALSPELASALGRVAVTVGAHWKALRRDFRALDGLGGGVLSQDDFRDALRKHGVNLDESEFEYVCRMYSRGGDGQKVAYNDFIRDFLKAGKN